MSYLRKFEYTLTPTHSFKIIRNCSGCGTKAVFHNTHHFRVNANGNKIDVWLIYQCTKCKHTNNLTIYTRLSPEMLSAEERLKFSQNDADLAHRYGTTPHFFAQNKAEVDWSAVQYQLEQMTSEPHSHRELHGNFSTGDLIILNNPSHLKIRSEKVISEVLNISRSKLNTSIKSGHVQITEDKIHHKLNIQILKDMDIEKTP